MIQAQQVPYYIGFGFLIFFLAGLFLQVRYGEANTKENTFLWTYSAVPLVVFLLFVLSEAYLHISWSIVASLLAGIMLVVCGVNLLAFSKRNKS